MKKYIIIIVGFLFLISNFCYAGYKKHQYLDNGKVKTFCLNSQGNYVIASTESTSSRNDRFVFVETDVSFNILGTYVFVDNNFGYDYDILDIVEYSMGEYIICGTYENDSAFIAFVRNGFGLINIYYLPDIQVLNSLFYTQYSNNVIACGKSYNQGIVLYFSPTPIPFTILDGWQTADPNQNWEFHKISNLTSSGEFYISGTDVNRNNCCVLKMQDNLMNLNLLASNYFTSPSNYDSYSGICAYEDTCFVTVSNQTEINTYKLELNGNNFIMSNYMYFNMNNNNVFLKDFKVNGYTFAWTGYYYDNMYGKYSGFMARADYDYNLLPTPYSNPTWYSYSSQVGDNTNYYLYHLEQIPGFSSIGYSDCPTSIPKEIICADPAHSNICNESINSFNIQYNNIANLNNLPCNPGFNINSRFYFFNFYSNKYLTTDSCSGPSPISNNISLTKDDNFTVGQNQPNPSNLHTVISYFIPENGNVNFVLTDISGKIMYQENIEAHEGSQELNFNTSMLASGIYYYSMEYQGQRIVKKMTIQR